MSPTVPRQPAPGLETNPAWIPLVRDMVDGLHFGIVQQTVHDGHATRIERTEHPCLAPARARADS